MSVFQSRRSFTRALLGASGATAVGLPFLESLLPRHVRAQAKPPTRLVFFYVPNGIQAADFRPKTTGSAYAMTPILKPLEALRADFSVVSGLENVNARPDAAGDHASGTAAFITCTHANKSETNIRNGVSADQLAAQQIGKLTRLPSLELGIDGGSTAGDCDSGYACAYTRNISWSGPATPMPKLTNPELVFDRLFAGYDAGASAAEAEKRRAYRKSVLDLVLGDAQSLALRLGSSDRAKLDEYLSGVRELELQLGTSGEQSSCEPGTRPAANPPYANQVKMMCDLMVLAMQCDVTRVFTFMLGNGLSGRTYPELGITRGHHEISHHGNDATNLAQLTKIAAWEMERLAYLMSRLKDSADDASSNLLYNSAIFLSSDISDGNAHNHDEMPIVLAGHGGGALKPGRHIAYDRGKHTKVANLLVRMLSTVGVDATVGDSDGSNGDV